MAETINISRASFRTTLRLDDYDGTILRPEQSKDAVRLESRIHVPAIHNHGAVHPGPSDDRKADRDRFLRYLQSR